MEYDLAQAFVNAGKDSAVYRYNRNCGICPFYLAVIASDKFREAEKVSVSNLREEGKRLWAKGYDAQLVKRALG